MKFLIKHPQGILYVVAIILLMTQASAVNTCVNTTYNYTLCFETGSQIYENGLNLYEGKNDKYGLYIENPSDKLNQGYIDSLIQKIKGAFDTGKIDPKKLGDKTTFTFESYTDFYNLLQQKNAIGNVTLFTQSDINRLNREKTSELTGEVNNWTYVLLILVVEFFKMIISVGALLVVIFVFFRGIPWCLNFIKKMTIKFYLWKVGK